MKLFPIEKRGKDEPRLSSLIVITKASEGNDPQREVPFETLTAATQGDMVALYVMLHPRAALVLRLAPHNYEMEKHSSKLAPHF